MHRHRPALLAAAALAALWMGVAPAAVVAECFPRPPAGTAIPIAHAFTATVLDLSTEVDQEAKDAGEGDGLVWHIELRVGHVYRGSVPGRLSLTGYTLSHRSCSYFLGEHARVGQTLFVAIDDQTSIESNTELFGQLLLWQRVNDRWSFHEDALRDGQDPASYPNAAREARTTQQILAAIASVAPNTATAPDPASVPVESRVAVPLIWVLPVFAITFLAYICGYIGPRSRKGRDAD